MKKLAFVFLVTTLSGCASIVNDKNQVIHVNASNGQELSGSVHEITEKKTRDGRKVKKEKVYTPVSKLSGSDVILARSSAKKVVMVDNPECEKETPIKSSIDGMFFGNILIGGLLGSTTDATTGKMWKYEEKVVVQCK
jgi:uncharacterized protein YceK